MQHNNLILDLVVGSVMLVTSSTELFLHSQTLRLILGNQQHRTEHCFTGLAENCTSDDSDSHLKTKLVCFYIFTKEFQPGIMRDLCTHIIVGFFGINEETYCLDNSTEKLQVYSFFKKKKDCTEIDCKIAILLT